MRATLASLLLLAAAMPVAAADIACDGPLGADATLADIEAAYGAANVVTGEVDGPEGTTLRASTVFPDDPARRFMVYWWDEEKAEGLIGFTIADADTSPGGVRVGMGIGAVEALNGGPFELTGFYWDYGGSVYFDQGGLAALPGDCTLLLRFSPAKEPATEAISDAVSGDQLIRSDLPELRLVEPLVTVIHVAYPLERYAPED